MKGRIWLSRGHFYLGINPSPLAQADVLVNRSTLHQKNLYREDGFLITNVGNDDSDGYLIQKL